MLTTSVIVAMSVRLARTTTAAAVCVVASPTLTAWNDEKCRCESVEMATEWERREREEQREKQETECGRLAVKGERWRESAIAVKRACERAEEKRRERENNRNGRRDSQG